MTVEADLVTVLETVADRVFLDFAKVSTARPYVTLQQVGGWGVSFSDATVPDSKHGEFQVNVWADSRVAAAALMLQVEAALIQASQFVARPIAAPVSDFDADVPVYGSRQSFSVFSDR
jgi:hypothetical protein